MRKIIIVLPLLLSILILGCDHNSGGGSGGGSSCVNLLLGEMLNPDWEFTPGQSTPPATQYACEIENYNQDCNPNYCYYQTQKFCCFYWPGHADANETGHLSMTYTFMGIDDGVNITWLCIDSQPGEALCDLSCPTIP